MIAEDEFESALQALEAGGDTSLAKLAALVRLGRDRAQSAPDEGEDARHDRVCAERRAAAVRAAAVLELLPRFLEWFAVPGTDFLGVCSDSQDEFFRWLTTGQTRPPWPGGALRLVRGRR